MFPALFFDKLMIKQKQLPSFFHPKASPLIIQNGVASCWIDGLTKIAEWLATETHITYNRLFFFAIILTSLIFCVNDWDNVYISVVVENKQHEQDIFH